MDENFPDPGGHFVGLRSSKMNVEHKDRHTNAEIGANFAHQHNKLPPKSVEKEVVKRPT